MVWTAADLQRKATRKEDLFLQPTIFPLANVDRAEKVLLAPEEREAPHLGRTINGVEPQSSVYFHQTEATALSLVLDDVAVLVPSQQTLSNLVVQEGIDRTQMVSKSMALVAGDVFCNQVR